MGNMGGMKGGPNKGPGGMPQQQYVGQAMPHQMVMQTPQQNMTPEQQAMMRPPQ